MLGLLLQCITKESVLTDSAAKRPGNATV